MDAKGEAIACANAPWQPRSLTSLLRSSYMFTVLNYIWPFEGNLEADVAPGENEFDTPGLDLLLGFPLVELTGSFCDVV